VVFRGRTLDVSPEGHRLQIELRVATAEIEGAEMFLELEVGAALDLRQNPRLRQP
jgi:hypothetical protein